MDGLPRLSVWQFRWQDMVAVAKLLERTVQLNVSIVGGTLYIDNGEASTSAEPVSLYSAS
jgi:uncharacterized protein YaeQ